MIKQQEITIYLIYCNRCGTAGTAGVDQTQLLLRALRDGWKEKAGGDHICPSCLENECLDDDTPL